MNVDDLNNRALLMRELALFKDDASKFGLIEHVPKPHDSYKDFRDYDPYRYKVSADELFADCVWPKNPFKLDTAYY